MSRGFVKEGDQEEPAIIPPRAALPAGVTNYVTLDGLEELKAEKETLENERANITVEDEAEKRRMHATVDGKLNLLIERINSARVLKAEDQHQDEVRFGASVKIKNLSTNTFQDFQIVGVDEANVKKKKIAFVAPIATAITGKKVGEVAEFKLGNESRNLEIIEIKYS